MRGATRRSRFRIYLRCDFNPRTPCGVRPAALATLIKTAKISIHAPLAGCDKTHPPCAKACRYFNPRTPCGVRRVVLRNTITKIDISIHAPLAGCDPCSGISFRAAHDFNPRTPCGVRLRVGLFLDGKLDFNPRTPCGVRPASISRVSGVQVFQSTHPLRGATEWQIVVLYLYEISIHAPLAGCDSKNVQRKLHFF